MSPTASSQTARSTVSGSGIIITLAGLLVVASVVLAAARGLVQPGVALAFGIFICIGELLRVTLPGERTEAPLALAGGLAYAVLLHLPDEAGIPVDATHGALQVVAVTATGMLLGSLPHVAAGRVPAIDAVARRVLVVAFAAVTFRGLASDLDAQGGDRWRASLVVLMVAVAMLAWLLDGVLGALISTERTRAPFRALLRNELSALAGIGAAVGSTGLLIALACEVMGLWALPVLSVPLLLTQFSFRRYASIRATYLQTIRSLSRVTDLGGYTESGHARRVSELAVAVGRDLGMRDEELRELEYAALMHDVGQLSLSEPIPGGATLMVTATEQRRIAALGADVIRQTGVLDGVAVIVERQAEPYRAPQLLDDGDVPLAARIIKVANAYDDLVGGSLEIGRTLDALERLRLGSAYEYDPRVVESLATVLTRSVG